MNDLQELNVIMVAPRGVGKTSLLAAMQEEFNKTFESAGLTTWTTDTQTLDAIEECKRLLRNMDYRLQKLVDPTPPKLVPWEDEGFVFEVGSGGRNPGIDTDTNTRDGARRLQRDDEPTGDITTNKQSSSTPQPSPVFPSSIANRLTSFTLFDLHNALNDLADQEFSKVVCVVRALRCISENESFSQAMTVLNKAEKYLNELSQSPTDSNDDDFLQENFNWQPSHIFYSFFHRRERWASFYQEINDLNIHQKKELIAIGYYLKRELNTREEFDYIRKVLGSYLEEIKQFRSPQRPQ